MTQGPAPGVILPGVAGELKAVHNFVETLRLTRFEILNDNRVAGYRLFAFLPVLAHFGHAFAVPNRSSGAKGLVTIGVYRFMLRDAALGGRIDGRLGHEAFAIAQLSADRHAGLALDEGSPFGIDHAGAPFV